MSEVTGLSMDEVPMCMGHPMYMVMDRDTKVPRAATVREWGETYQNPDLRRIASSHVKVRKYRKPRRGGYRKPPKKEVVWVSTVFLGISTMMDGREMFETMVFGGRRDQWQDRYDTYAEAVAGHKKMCALVRRSHCQ